MTPLGMIAIFALCMIFGAILTLAHAYIAGGLLVLIGLAMFCKICMEIIEANKNSKDS